MPDYMFMLESRLSPEQHAALERVRELARMQQSNVYLTGGAVRDLITGAPLRDLDFTIEGNPSRIVLELEKGGARVAGQDEQLGHYEMIFAGDADGSIAAARAEIYERPGTRVEHRWSTVTEDLRRRDFSVNAIAISLNPGSRGLMLDPTNGLADIERREVRALSIHAFTNQPIRLLRILRFCARLGFKMEARTQEWFELAIDRDLHESISGADVGQEVRQLAREDNPAAVLKAWDSRNLLSAIHPRLALRKPGYDDLNRLARLRESIAGVGVRPRLLAPVVHYTLARLRPRERAAALRHMAFRAAEIKAVASLVPETRKVLKILKGRKTSAPKDAYFFLSKTPFEFLAFMQTEFPHPRAISKIRNYFQKWRPLRLSLPVAELDTLGISRGPKFDKILEALFELQLRGKGRTPPERTKLLKQLAGIKEEPKKKRKEEKKKAKQKSSEAAKAKTKMPEPPAAPVPKPEPSADQPKTDVEVGPIPRAGGTKAEKLPFGQVRRPKPAGRERRR